MKSYIVAISGASGSVYSIRLIKELLKAGHRVYLTISKQAFSIIKTETGINWVGDLPAGRQSSTLRAGNSEIEIEKNMQKYFSSKHIRFFNENNLHAPISSGSFITDGMLVVPCSMKTLSGIANGYASN
ncbi:MAG: flavoprotein, partial [Nitrospirota bacterium]